MVNYILTKKTPGPDGFLKESSTLTLWKKYIFIHSTIIIEHELQDCSIKMLRQFVIGMVQKAPLPHAIHKNQLQIKISTPCIKSHS